MDGGIVDIWSVPNCGYRGRAIFFYMDEVIHGVILPDSVRLTLNP